MVRVTTHCTTVFLLEHDFRRCWPSLKESRAADWYVLGYGEGWETDVIRHFNLASQQMLGMWKELSARVETLTTNAARTGDKFQEVSLRVRFAIRHLLVDQPDVANVDITDALASWQPSDEAFGNQSAWALWTRTRVILYQREFGKLHEAVDADWQRACGAVDRSRARAQERMVPRVRHVLPRPRDRRARSCTPLRIVGPSAFGDAARPQGLKGWTSPVHRRSRGCSRPVRRACAAAMS